MKRLFISTLIVFTALFHANAQLLQGKHTFSRADTLRGMLTPLRTCYDINYYHLDVKVDIDSKSISGSNEFNFTATTDFKQLQFDLFSNLTIEKVVYKNQELPFKREFNAVFVTFPATIKKGVKEKFKLQVS